MHSADLQRPTGDTHRDMYYGKGEGLGAAENGINYRSFSFLMIFMQGKMKILRRAPGDIFFPEA